MKRTSIEHKSKLNIGACTPVPNAALPPSHFLPLTYTPNLSVISTATATLRPLLESLGHVVSEYTLNIDL